LIVENEVENQSAFDKARANYSRMKANPNRKQKQQVYPDSTNTQTYLSSTEKTPTRGSLQIPSYYLDFRVSKLVTLFVCLKKSIIKN